MIVLKVLFYREDPRLREQEWGNFQVEGSCQMYMQPQSFFLCIPTQWASFVYFCRILQKLNLQWKTEEKLEHFIIDLPLVKGTRNCSDLT